MNKLFLVVITLILAGCTGLKVVKYDPNELGFKTFKKINIDDFQVYEPHESLGDYDFIYLRSIETLTAFDKDYHRFLDNMLSQTEVKPILRRHQIEDLYINLGLEDSFPNINSRVGQIKLSKLLGKFLVLDIGTYQHGSLYRVEAQIYDPFSNKVYMQYSKKTLAMIDFDKEIMLPILNEIIGWYELSSSKSSPLRGFKVLEKELQNGLKI